jgi:hypothetical protein
VGTLTTIHDGGGGKTMSASDFPEVAANSGDIYLIWSNEHRAFWRTGRFGYTPKVAEAQRFSQHEALNVCLAAMPGRRDGCPLNDMPVRLKDVMFLVDYFYGELPSDEEVRSPPSSKVSRG